MPRYVNVGDYLRHWLGTDIVASFDHRLQPRADELIDLLTLSYKKAVWQNSFCRSRFSFRRSQIKSSLQLFQIDGKIYLD